MQMIRLIRLEQFDVIEKHTLNDGRIMETILKKATYEGRTVYQLATRIGTEKEIYYIDDLQLITQDNKYHFFIHAI